MLEVKNLGKKYGETQVFSDLSFTLDDGTCTAVIGPNGVGKTTLVECIAGLRKPDSGQVFIDGQDVTNRMEKLKNHVYIQMQQHMTLKGTKVREIVYLMKTIYRKETSVTEILRPVDMEKLKDKYIHKLSGGEQQRLEIALSLIADVGIVIYDELTSGLDPIARRNVYGILKELKKESKAILYVTHYMEEINLFCDNIIALKKDSMALYDTSEKMMREYGSDLNKLFFDLYQGAV